MFKKITGLVGYLLFLFLILEITVRLFLSVDMGVPFFKPSELIYKYYPELKSVPAYKDNKTYDILLLGASTLNRKVGDIEPLLYQKLNGKTPYKVRIYNLAIPAHASLDSLYKYQALRGRQFDLVLLYDGINEVRANACPPAMFKDDYSHYAWYEEISLLKAHPEINVAVLPYLIHKLFAIMYDRAAHIEYVPTIAPKEEWLKYGADIKTRNCFKRNIEAILAIAQEKHEQILLMSFAYYVPQDYSLDKFTKKQLDYGYLPLSAPVEEWGSPMNIIKGLQVHNDVIREMALFYPDIVYVDQEGLMPKNGVYFGDICHFTRQGCEQFVDNMVHMILHEMHLKKAGN